jgi:GH15 family glucan-1,4-alpha-glucosidase
VGDETSPCADHPRDRRGREPLTRKPSLNDDVERIDGYAPIRGYAAIGDGRTVALVARDGAIDWLCLPDLDSPSVFAALLDSSRGGRFVLEPTLSYEATRRYVPGTNVLETTFRTAEGAVRVTDAMTLPVIGLAPYRELVRRVEGLSGAVPIRWLVEPRFRYATAPVRLGRRGSVRVATAGRDALAVHSWDAGEVESSNAGIRGTFVAREETVAVVALSTAHQEPLVFPSRYEVEERFEGTVRYWGRWSEERVYDGPWRDAVVRSALALKLLVHAPSGAIAAAATTSLPEEIGGTRNWDYRFSWPRDAAFTLQALLSLGCAPEARAFFSWLLHASQLTHPRVQVLYRLDGRSDADEKELALSGYRSSRPVRIGNEAIAQTQLDVYGEVLQAAARLVDFQGRLDRDQGRRLGGLADFVCSMWKQPDAGIWETRAEPKHFTQSKMMCAIALRRARELAERGLVPAEQADSWRQEEERVRTFVETRCYSEKKNSYVRSAGDEDLDASLLLALLAGYDEPGSPRLRGTVEAVMRELGRGPFVHRYLGDDGLAGENGAFLPCSFWLVDALARQGRSDEAATLMDDLIGLSNDVGLYAEEIAPDSGDFLGNFPQGLTHLALVNAAVTVAREQNRER